MQEQFSLFPEGETPKGALAEMDRALLETRFWELLEDRMRRYTMGESSSVTMETAQELMKSVVFSVSAALRASPDAFALLRSGDTAALLKTAWAGIERELAEGKKLLAGVFQSTPGVEDRAYRDTVRELAQFFKRYDYRFFAHSIPCSLDYQLILPVPETLEGICYVREYLRRLLIENTVLRRFRPAEKAGLLRGMDAEYGEHLMGIFEPVLVNAFGCALLGRPPGELAVSDAGRGQLLRLLRAMPEEGWRDALESFCAALTPGDEEARCYVRAAVQEMLPRIRAAVEAQKLERVFVPGREETPAKPAVVFRDGEPMEDEHLRALVGEMSGCRFVSDKIAILKREVRSLRDAAEILNACFWGEECAAYYRTLGPRELALLLWYVREKRRESPGYASESGWEERLEEYVRTLGGPEGAALQAFLRPGG